MSGVLELPVGASDPQIWEPTCRLRWASAAGLSSEVDPILQQAWRDRVSGEIEWRNVPVEIISDDEFLTALSQ